jgi:hypothetical protein
MHLAGFVRFLCQSVIVRLQALALVWAGVAPLVWSLRDGLGPDAVDSGWAMPAYKFGVMWGIPALVLAKALAVVLRIDRRLALAVAMRAHKHDAAALSGNAAPGSDSP